MTQREKINQYLSTLTSPRFIKLGGIDYFVERWEKTCSDMPYDDQYFIDEHLNDLTFRFKIDKVLNLFKLPDDLSTRLENADKQFLSKSIEIDRCFLSKVIEEKRNLSREHNWYYYRLPKERLAEWKEYILTDPPKKSVRLRDLKKSD